MIFVDAHVHIYDYFDIQTFLDSAFANFEAEAARYGQEDAFTALLLLTETVKDNWFQRLAGYAGDGTGTGSKTINNWSFHRTEENCSLYVQPENSQGLFLIVGHILHSPWGSSGKCRSSGGDHSLHPRASKKRIHYRKDNLTSPKFSTKYLCRRRIQSPKMISLVRFSKSWTLHSLDNEASLLILWDYNRMWQSIQIGRVKTKK